ncbi:MAG: hypothetical protein LKJ03_02405 [Enterococcaceae bacterium]|nr:hypothetical protein [Enterococcaceae bacterium]MCI1918639.1 hypothetical protein [Enterococcaceae bacterium]
MNQKIMWITTGALLLFLAGCSSNQKAKDDDFGASRSSVVSKSSSQARADSSASSATAASLSSSAAETAITSYDAAYQYLLAHKDDWQYNSDEEREYFKKNEVDRDDEHENVRTDDIGEYYEIEIEADDDMMGNHHHMMDDDDEDDNDDYDGAMMDEKIFRVYTNGTIRQREMMSGFYQIYPK